MSYQIHCPNCSTAIPPENINVQKIIAVCPECGAVFNFTDNVPSTQKVKRRKTKKPDYITQYESDDGLKLEMPAMVSSNTKFLTAFLVVFLVGLYALIANKAWSDSEITELTVFSIIFLPLILSSLASFVTKQSITANTEQLRHDIRLFGIPFYKREIDVAGIVDVSAEEMTSTRESVAKARYNLYADKYDQRQEMFMQNIPEEMATYSQQVLSNYLGNDEDSGNDRLRIQDESMLVEEASLSNDMQSVVNSEKSSASQ